MTNEDSGEQSQSTDSAISSGLARRPIGLPAPAAVAAYVGAIAFTAVLLFLMVGGSFWIMVDLHTRMAL